MTPNFTGNQDISSNFTPYFEGNQGKFSPESPYFYYFEDAFLLHPLITGIKAIFSEKVPYHYHFKDAFKFHPHFTGKWGQLLKKDKKKHTKTVNGKPKPSDAEGSPRNTPYFLFHRQFCSKTPDFDNHGQFVSRNFISRKVRYFLKSTPIWNHHAYTLSMKSEPTWTQMNVQASMHAQRLQDQNWCHCQLEMVPTVHGAHTENQVLCIIRVSKSYFHPSQMCS